MAKKLLAGCMCRATAPQHPVGMTEARSRNIWRRFGQMLRYLAYRLVELHIFFVCWTLPLQVILDMGQLICWLTLPIVMGLPGTLVSRGGFGLGCPPLRMLAGPIQHLRAAILVARRQRAAAELRARKGFRGGPLLDIPGSRQLIFSLDRDKMLLRGILGGWWWWWRRGGRVGMAFDLASPRMKMFPADSVEERTRMDTGSGTVRGPLLCISGKNPSLPNSWHKTRVSGSVASCGTVFFCQLTPRIGISPWAVSTSDSVDARLENGLGGIGLILALSGTAIGLLRILLILLMTSMVDQTSGLMVAVTKI